MDMTKALKRHKQVGQCAGGGHRAAEYKKEGARLRRAATAQGMEEERGEESRSEARSHLDGAR